MQRRRRKATRRHRGRRQAEHRDSPRRQRALVKAEGFFERHDIARDRIAVFFMLVIGQAELNLFILGREIMASEQTIPDSKNQAHILVPMRFNIGMVELMLFRADEPFIERFAKANADMRMAQIIAEHIE